MWKAFETIFWFAHGHTIPRYWVPNGQMYEWLLEIESSPESCSPYEQPWEAAS